MEANWFRVSFSNPKIFSKWTPQADSCLTGCGSDQTRSKQSLNEGTNLVSFPCACLCARAHVCMHCSLPEPVRLVGQVLGGEVTRYPASESFTNQKGRWAYVERQSSRSFRLIWTHDSVPMNFELKCTFAPVLKLIVMMSL